MLRTNSDNHTADLFHPCEPAVSRGVRAVMDLVHSEDRAEFTVSDLACELGVTIRALELAFGKEVDTTPNAYLLRTRLKPAPEDLLRGLVRDGATVTDG